MARTGRPTRSREAFALAERARTPRDRILTLEQVRCATRPRLRGVSDLDADDHELLDSNVRSFEFRKTLGVIAYIPRLVLFDDPWGVDDDKLVSDVCPTDHDLRVWLWILEQDARRVFGAREFLEAFAAARDRIEQRA